MKGKPGDPPVTDHAVIRYMERVMGLDIDALRRQIHADVKHGIALGACGVVKGGFNYRISQGVVVTILKAGWESAHPRDPGQGAEE